MIGFFRRLSDERYRRAEKRRRTEEIMGWVCVPVILMMCWFGWQIWDQTLSERPQLREQIIPGTSSTQRR